MQTANIILALAGDTGNTVPKFGVTAAEIAVLRLLHGEDAVFDIEPVGEIQQSHRAEIERLSKAYGKTQPDGRYIAPAVSALYPGAAARVFEKLSELDLPEELFKPVERAKPRAKAEGEPTTAAKILGDMSVAELKAHAEASGIDLNGATKKADIAAAIEAATAAPEASDPDDEDGIGDMSDGNTGMFD